MNMGQNQLDEFNRNNENFFKKLQLLFFLFWFS